MATEPAGSNRPGPDYHFPRAGERPLRFGGSSNYGGAGEPWWAMGEATARTLAPHGYDVTVLAEAASVQNPRFVADGRADIGITSPNWLARAYEGTGAYAGEGRRDHLRAIACVDRPSWTAVAVTRESMITDLAQIKERRLPVRMFAAVGADNILAYYGLTREEIVSYGGTDIQRPREWGFIQEGQVDLIIGNLYLANSPVGRRWIEASVLLNLRFLDLPDPLIEQLLAEGSGYRRSFIPQGYVRGVDHDVPSVVHPYLFIYTRDDAPDDFVRLLAREYDRNRQYWRETHVNFAYDPDNVALHAPVPLHPAALAYYKERGFPTPE